MGELKGSHRNSSRYVETFQGANIEKMINELSVKLIQLSGEDCEIEVDVRLRFPKKQQRKADSKDKESRSSSRRSSKKVSKERKTSTSKRTTEANANKMRDFVFDVSSYATTDARDNQNGINLECSRVRRRSSPDIITFNGMCNPESENSTASSSKSSRNYDYSSSNASSASSASSATYASTPSTSQVFPKADAKYKRSGKN